ncbi:MAG: hypothetical protein H6540_04550 [Bacteroidales bacterium]|nr:hypothetical protein [Bacteroidales bacterium]MCB9012413.1 hypothetical protein [Bacteroidales bacterium]
MTENINHSTDDKIQELCDLIESSPEVYKHLQVFLHRERDTDSRPDNDFLMVTPRVFGKVKVLDLTVEGDYIFVKFLDCFTKHVGCVKIDIHDASPATFFICWQDIRKMVLDETATISND